MCVSPYIAKTKDGKAIPVPCGHCLQCRKQYQAEWTFRLKQESRRTLYPAFITLTYNDDFLPQAVDHRSGEIQPVVCKRDWQLFMKRLRKRGGEFMKDARYFAIGEYGSKYNRPHMHAVLICPNIPNIPFLRALVDACWTDNGESMGFIKVEFARFKQFQYVCKYMNKLDNREHLVEPWRMFSRSLGLNFLSQSMVNYYLTTFDRTCINDRARIALPRYYRNKLTDFACQLLPGFAESGLSWSDCLEDYKPKENTMAWHCKNFAEHFEDYLEAAIVRVTQYVDGFEVDQYLNNPNRQDAWQAYVNQHKIIADWQREDARILFDCALRNHVDKFRGYSPQGSNVLILQE